MTVVKSAARAFVIVADDRRQIRTVAVVARAFFPDAHGEQVGDERRMGQIENRSVYQPKIARINIDQYARLSAPSSRQLFMQTPDDGGMEHSKVILQKPRIAEWCLTRR